MAYENFWQPEKDLVTSSKPFSIFMITTIKQLDSNTKMKLAFWRIFDNLKNILFIKEFLECGDYISYYLLNLESGLEVKPFA